MSRNELKNQGNGIKKGILFLCVYSYVGMCCVNAWSVIHFLLC
jgi:hypothetical protein